MTDDLPKEQTRFWRVAEIDGVELLRAYYREQAFRRHFHEGYAVGVIESGALGFSYRGTSLVATTGLINLVVPGESHDGFAAGKDGWRYRMFYLSSDFVQRAASEFAGKPKGLPFFKEGVIDDPGLARELRALHVAFERPHTTLLEKEVRLLSVLSKWITRHAQDWPVIDRPIKTHSSVRIAREYLEANCSQRISLGSLSSVAGLSRYHFLRLFAKEVGLTPHAYLNLVRVRKARELLGKGHPIVDVALATGFADQSHMNRLFKQILGLTPGTYRNSVLESLSLTQHY